MGLLFWLFEGDEGRRYGLQRDLSEALKRVPVRLASLKLPADFQPISPPGRHN
jgi:hypothetical protein